MELYIMDYQCPKCKKVKGYSVATSCNSWTPKCMLPKQPKCKDCNIELTDDNLFSN